MATITLEGIKTLVKNSQAALERAIIAIENRQTSDKRAAGATKHVNGRGWSAWDAVYMGEMFEWIMVGTTPRGAYYTTRKGVKKSGYGKAIGTTLMGAQVAKCREIIEKYAGQLLEVAGGAASPASPATTATTASPATLVALIQAIAIDLEEGGTAEIIAGMLAAQGWQVIAPAIAPQAVAMAPPCEPELSVDPEPQEELAVAGAIEAHYEEPGF